MHSFTVALVNYHKSIFGNPAGRECFVLGGEQKSF